MSGQVRILETTIRDGGYMFDHHFGRSQIASIVSALDLAGFPFIEVGHGMGAFSERFVVPELRPKTLPRVDSLGHAAASVKVATRAKVGVLLCAGPRLAPVDTVDEIADLGFSFLRLAIMPDESLESLVPYIQRGKQRGLIMSINMMQTYARPPELVADFAARAAGAGLDWFYVVDSAGGMPADQIKRYVTAILRHSDVAVGLHSHNNVGCAVANSLAAVEAGATLVDGTLNGMGRATGNPATEQLALVLRDRLAHPVDLDAIIGVSRTLRSSLERGNEPFDFVSGAALIHSRNVTKALNEARARGRAPAQFLLELGRQAIGLPEVPIVDFPPEIYCAATERVPIASKLEPTEPVIGVVRDDVLARYQGGALAALETLLLAGQQRRLPTALHLSRAAAAVCTRAVPWATDSIVGITVPWLHDLPQVDPILRPDYLLVDGDDRPGLAPRCATWPISFADVRARAVRDLAQLVRATGATLWSPDGAHRELLGDLPCQTGPHRGAGPHAVIVGSQLVAGADLAAGDTVIAVDAVPTAFVDAARARGVRVMQPSWPTAVASVAASLLALEAATAETDGPLVPGCVARGTGQASWDPSTASLLDADEPAEAARQIAEAYIASVWNGGRL